jgi:hypothetical protein
MGFAIRIRQYTFVAETMFPAETNNSINAVEAGKDTICSKNLRRCDPPNTRPTASKLFSD